MFFTKERKRKVASGHHTANRILRASGTSRTACLTFPRKGIAVPAIVTLLDSPPLQGFARFALDGIFLEVLFRSTLLSIFYSLYLQYLRALNWRHAIWNIQIIGPISFYGTVDFSPPGQKVNHDCKVHTPPLWGFARFALDGAYGTSGNNEELFTVGVFA